jgi:hypothetical protein
MTIAILFQQSHYWTFKAFYTEPVLRHLRGEFPHLISYSRFVELLPTVLAPLIVYLHTQLGVCTGVSFIDSTALAVGTNPRIGQHRVYALDAARGKTSVGWFYGVKRHLVSNDRGELLALCLTPGNVDDRRPVHCLVRRLFDPGDKLLLRKRAIIESMVDELKNVCQIEHSRHRSPRNFRVNLMAGLIAYRHLPKKPSLDLGLLVLPAALLIPNSRYGHSCCERDGDSIRQLKQEGARR